MERVLYCLINIYLTPTLKPRSLLGDYPITQSNEFTFYTCNYIMYLTNLIASLAVPQLLAATQRKEFIKYSSIKSG